MGGVDKGLQLYNGRPLVQHAIDRLAPQVGALMVNANRNLDAYRAFGVEVVADTVPDFAGPLAGWLAGLAQCRTEWLVSVPCDSPRLPLDLVASLAAAAGGASVVIARTPEGPQPVFALLRRDLCASLADYLESGGRKVDGWTAQQCAADCNFDSASAFFNANTLLDLRTTDGGI